MNIDRYRQHHVAILKGVKTLRELAHQGVAERAVDIARELKALALLVTQHLAIEDRILYPSLEKSGNEAMAAMSVAYQGDMKGIASAFIGFSRRWSDAAQLVRDPEGFRTEANTVLKSIHERIARENREFYPAIEAL